MRWIASLTLALGATVLSATARVQAQGYGGTVEGSFAHGMADIVRSAGEYNLRTSEAYKNYEDARRKNIDNRLLEDC